MRGKIFTIFLLSLIVFVSGCNEDMTSDLDDLQSQIDELNTKLDEVQAGQQQSLLDAIAALEESIKSLEGDNEGLLEDLEGIEEEIANNSSAIYYGDLLTQSAYDEFTAQGATIVTGKVVANTAAHVSALSGVKVVGGDLEISAPSAVALPNLTSVGGDFVLYGVTGDVASSLATLGSVGGDLIVMENDGLASFTADALVLINGALDVQYNEALTTLSLASLDWVGSIYIDEENSDNIQNYMGALNSIDLSYTDVAGDVYITRLGIGGDLTIGQVGGNFDCNNNGLNSIDIKAETISGDFNLDSNALTELKADNLKRVEGDFKIGSTHNTFADFGEPVYGLETMPSFDALTYVGGDFTIENNQALITMESFNSVTEINKSGAQITLSNNGETEFINVFNALETTFPYSYQYVGIFIGETTNWFNGFNSLTKAKVLSITISAPGDDGGFGVSAAKTTEAIDDIAKFEGFDATTEVNQLYLTIHDVTEFDAFGVLDNFSSYGSYLSINMPSDASVDLCSMIPIFTKITNGDFSSKSDPSFMTADFNFPTVSEAITQLTDDCAI